MIETAIQRLQAKQDLSIGEMEQCVLALISGNVPDPQIERFLTCLHEKGETVPEVVGGALALRRQAVPVRFTQPVLVDTCGTGGDGSRTFNISTAAAIVAAACGVAVAKHGNRKITSQSGSADVLSELGVDIACDVATAQRCLDRSGVCFLFAPQFHPAMRHVSAVRQRLPFPTLFNMLGPLANPAGVHHQVLGVGKPGAWDLLVGAVSYLAGGTCLVVRGRDGLGEMSTMAPTDVAVIQPADPPLGNGVPDDAATPFSGCVEFQVWDARDYDLGGGRMTDIQVESPAASADLIRRIFGGESSTARNMVVWNAAAALWLVDPKRNLEQAIQRCHQAIDSGAAASTLEKLTETSHVPSS